MVGAMNSGLIRFQISDLKFEVSMLVTDLMHGVYENKLNNYQLIVTLIHYIPAVERRGIT